MSVAREPLETVVANAETIRQIQIHVTLKKKFTSPIALGLQYGG